MSDKQDILDRLHDLHRQVTKERRHCYIGSVIRAAAREIHALRKQVQELETRLARLSEGQ